MRFRLPTALAVAGLSAAALAAGVAAPEQALAATTPSVKTQILATAKTAIVAMAKRSGANDAQFMASGRFRFAGVACPRCELGPAVAAAALYRRTGDSSMRKLALGAMDTAIRTQVQRDGSFSKPAPGESDNTIQTVFFAQHLGSMLFFFGPTLDGAHRKVYQRQLTRSADVLVKRGMLGYYVNGNINLATTVVMGDAWKQTGSAKYRGYYEKSLSFTLKPKGKQWAQYGLRVTKKGSASLGRNSSGYLAEMGAHGAGFDPEYTHFQADIASLGYRTIGDARLLQLTNQLTNQLLARVDTRTWAYDITGGSRKARTTGVDHFSTAAYYVAATNGRGADLKPALAQVRSNLKLMRDSGTTPWAGVYQAWGSSFATTIYSIA